MLMKGTSTWSYRPYRPPLTEVGDIYICRIVPQPDKIHFEWLSLGNVCYDVYVRKRGEGDFIHWETTEKTESNIFGLSDQTEYEFFVRSGEKKSRVRLARCGASIGTIVNYLHPEDEAYAFRADISARPRSCAIPTAFCSPPWIFLREIIRRI